MGRRLVLMRPTPIIEIEWHRFLNGIAYILFR